MLEHGFLKGSVKEMMENHIGPIFMPHGLGHFMGLETHDVGGYPEGTKRPTEPGFRNLRCGRILEAGMVITVEPGLYFIKHCIETAKKNPNQAKFLNFEKIKEFEDFGGVRIEDDVIVTPNGAENMTTAPRTVEEIEAVMAKVPRN